VGGLARTLASRHGALL